MSEESPVGASVASVMIEKSVWEMQNVVSSLDAYVEWVYSTTSDPGSAISIWTVEIVGHVVSRSWLDVSHERTACDHRKRRNCREALVQFNELVMLMTIEKPKDKGKIQNCVRIVLDLVDRSDEVVDGTTEIVVKGLVLFVACRRSSEVMPKTREVSEACEAAVFCRDS